MEITFYVYSIIKAGGVTNNQKYYKADDIYIDDIFGVKSGVSTTFQCLATRSRNIPTGLLHQVGRRICIYIRHTLAGFMRLNRSTYVQMDRTAGHYRTGWYFATLKYYGDLTWVWKLRVLDIYCLVYRAAAIDVTKTYNIRRYNHSVSFVRRARKEVSSSHL